MGHVHPDPMGSTSTRQLASVSRINRTSIQIILKKKLHPYKIHLVQELNVEYYDHHLQFCEIMSERAANDPQFHFNICFSNECSFFMNGTVNRHNCRYWSDSKLIIFQAVLTQQPQKLNVWAGIFGDWLVDPHFSPDNLTGEMYLQFLEDVILTLP